MSAAIFVAIFGSVFVCVAVALFLSMMSVTSQEDERKQRRARDLALYRHHPEANLLRLND